MRDPTHDRLRAALDAIHALAHSDQEWRDWYDRTRMRLRSLAVEALAAYDARPRTTPDAAEPDYLTTLRALANPPKPGR